MELICLNGSWQGVCIPPEIHADIQKSFTFPAAVPGCTISDLIAAGRLPADLFRGKNADSVLPYETCSWDYSRSFECHPDGRRCTLTFERLDTYCDVWLNGVHLEHRENGNISHAFDVTDAITEGTNTLRVRFYSPVLQVQGRPKRSGAFTTERLYTRRTQCTYGWDWLARFVSCGIAGDVSLNLRAPDEAAVDSAYIYTRHIDSDGACVGIDVRFSSLRPGRILHFEILTPDGGILRSIPKYCCEAFMRLNVDIPRPELWYPHGYGAQPLYSLIIRDGENLLHEERFGIRTVRILQLPDAEGSENHAKCLSIRNPDYDFNESFSGFILKVNGVRIMCKGANWVPCTPFESGSTREKVNEILALARDAGVNMLRIWGGGRFEKQHFYDECSRLGILVTQDFLMACGSYPEDEDWFIEQLRLEAEYAAKLMRNQPCLMWWSGDNENAVNGCDTDVDYSGRRSAYRGIAPVLWKEDPYRDFLPSSPFGGKKYASNTVGTTHNTQFLGEIFPWIMDTEDLSDYKEKMKEYRARFIAEEPQLGAVCPETLREIMTDAEISDESEDMWRYHTKTNPALPHEVFDYMAAFARKILGEFTDPQDRHFKYRYIQYEWLRLSLEQARREKWFCSGIIYWMLNDCWPAAAGWALLDYYNRPKAAYYSFRRAARPLMASIDRADDGFKVYAVNDSSCAMSVSGTLRRISADLSRAETIDSFSAEVSAGTSVVVLQPKLVLNEGEMLVVDMVNQSGQSDRSFWKAGTLHIRPAEVYFEDDGHSAVTVRAEKYLHAVEISGDILPEDNYFPLLPGESRKISYRKRTPDACVSVQAYTLH